MIEKISFLLTAAVIWAAGTAEAKTALLRFTPQAATPRIVKTDPEVRITLARKGKALCEVVAPRHNNSTSFAARELTSFLSQIIGSKVPLVSRPSGKVTAFILGGAGAKAAHFDLDKLDRDGFIIRTSGKNIIIAGRDDARGNSKSAERGTVNGVYEFLERFGGVRFYFPGEMGTVVPRKADWELPGISIMDRPDNQFRYIYCTGIKKLGNGKLNFYNDKTAGNVMRLSYLRLRESTIDLPNCHGLAYLDLVQRFAKSKPHIFALRDNGTRHDGSVIARGSDANGQLCFSNEELKEVIFQDAKALLTGQSARSRGIRRWVASRHRRPFFNLMPNDALYYCRCKGCYKAYTSGSQVSSDFIWKFKTDIARRLLKEKVPGFCTTMAYGNFRDIPRMDIPHNVIVMIAVPGPWNELNANQKELCQLLEKWSRKLKSKIYMWNYITKSTSLIGDIPGFTPRAVGNFYKKTAPWSFGCFLESSTDFWLFNAMNFYVYSKVMWNVKTDVDALMDEHLRLMYGSAAPLMKEFYDTLERHWLKDIMSNIRETNAGPKAVLPSKYDIWTKIYGPGEIARVNKLFDAAEKKAAKEKMALRRVKFMRKELWGKILDGARRFAKQSNDNKLWTIYVKPVKEKITIDGKLDEGAWKKASPVWMLPRTKEKAEVHTRVRMLADKEYFYVGIESDEPHTSKMLNVKRSFDETALWQDNLVELFFAGKHSDNTIYQIMLTSAGQICDLRNIHGTLNKKWNSGLSYKVGVIPGKMWVAEVKIPRKSMPEIKGGTFAVNFTRGRKLDPAVKVIEAYYSWSKFSKQFPEYCGTAVIGEKPSCNSVVAIGDFDAPYTAKGMRKGREFWCVPRKMRIDHQIFRTAGASICLYPKEGRVLRQFFPKGKLKSNTRYNLSFFVKLKGVSGGRKAPHAGLKADIRFSNGGKDSVFYPFVQQLTGTMDWTRFEFEFTTPANVGAKGNTYIGFYLDRRAKGMVWLDHIKMVEVIK